MESSRQIAGGPFCALCGGTFRARRADSDTPPLNWTSIIRYVSCAPSLMSPTLSNSYYVAWRGTGWPGMQANPAADTTIQGLEPYYLVDSRDGSTVFPFHEICWQILLIQLTQKTKSQPDHDDVGYWLFYVLSCIPRLNRRLIPRHEYHGVMAIRESSYLRSVLEAPIDYTPFPFNSAQNYSTPPFVSTISIPTQDPSLKDPFCQLPPEIIWEVILYLTYDDIHNARLSSRHFAMHTATARLPQRFWASRFSLEMNMGFVLVLEKNEIPYADIDWRELYDNCRSLLQQTGSNGDGFRNRQRIWICVQHVATTLANLLLFEKLNTIMFDLPAMSLSSYDLGPRVSCLELESRDRGSSSTSQFMDSKISRTGEILFQQHPNSGDTLIEYSTIMFESRAYISGLRVSVSPQQEPDSATIQEAGLLIPSLTKSVFLTPNRLSRDVSVYYSPDGIYGFDILTLGIDGHVDRLSIGNTGAANHNTVTTLLRSPRPITGLILGFDALKIVSMQLICEHPPTNLPLGPESSRGLSIPLISQARESSANKYEAVKRFFGRH